jgi:hypothetical protein
MKAGMKNEETFYEQNRLKRKQKKHYLKIL